MMIVAFPPLILGSILLEVERAFGLPFFDPTRGGDALLWQHLFWLFGHPDVYIIFLPMAGVLSTMIPVFANRALVGYRAIVVAIIALAFVSFGIWVHHMFTVGIPHLALAFFSVGSAIVAVPTAVQIFAWLATLAHGRPRWDVPMLYVFGFFFIFVMGGLTGVMLAMVPFDWQAHDTYFVVAHMHYVVAGALAFPMLAALYYWLPLLTGRTAVHRLSVPAFWLVFVGFNMTFFMMHLTGLRGMPRRIHTYPGRRRLELAQSAILGRRVRHGDWLRACRDRPRGSTPLWASRATQSLGLDDAGMGHAAPAGTLRLRLDPRCRRIPGRSTAPNDLASSLASGEGYLGFTRNGWQETLGVHMTSGVPEQLIVLPRATYLPLCIALITAGVVLGVSVQALPAVARPGTGGRGPLRVGRAERRTRARLRPAACRPRVSLPPHTEVADSPSWWALIFTLVIDGTLFASLVFGTLYLWIAAPNWPPRKKTRAEPVADTRSRRGARRCRCPGARIAPGRRRRRHVAGVDRPGDACAHRRYSGGSGADRRRHSASARACARCNRRRAIGFAVVHAGIGVLFLVSNFLRIGAGFVSPRRLTDLRLTRLWIDYTALTTALALGLVLALPALSGMLEARP